MERNREAGGSSNRQPREESGDGNVQIPASGKFIRSPASCHPQLEMLCASKCQLHPIPAQSYYHLSSDFNPWDLSPLAGTCPEQPRGLGASGLRGRGGQRNLAAGSEGERFRGLGELGPLPPAGAVVFELLAPQTAALNPPGSAVRGAVR